MTANKKHKPEVKWDRTAFEKMRATWPPERIAEDEGMLKNIFALAEDCPLLAEALAWARQHDMEFFVDRTVTGARGYHFPGTGVLGIAEKVARDPADAVGTLVHEIRHAWQNYNGLDNRSPGSFSEASIKQSLKEADAKVYGERAGDQYRAALLKKQGLPVPARLQKSLADENADLGAKFLDWFSASGTHTRYYGDDTSKRYGQRYGVFDRKLSEQHKEFKPARVRYPWKSMSIDNIQDVLRLGVNFSGTKNYLAALQPDILPKRILRPSLADTFWGAANDEQRKLTAEIRKAHLKQKLALAKGRARHPWP